MARRKTIEQLVADQDKYMQRLLRAAVGLSKTMRKLKKKTEHSPKAKKVERTRRFIDTTKD